MLNIKQTFVPTASSAAPQPGATVTTTTSTVTTGPSAVPVSPSPTLTPKPKSKTNLLLGIALLVLVSIGGGVAAYLTSVPQDLRQQASVTAGYGCQTVADCPTGYTFCNPNTHICAHSAYPCESFSDCPSGHGFSYCNLDSHTCGVMPTPIPDSPTPAPTGSGCNFTPGTPNCSNINAPSCSGYQTCHGGSGYDACYPNPGTNTCTYSVGGTTCTAACPATMPAGLSRCHCSNDVWTIGVVPAGGSCDQLCACTGNVCTTCQNTPGPTHPPGPTTPPAGPQCTNIQMLNLAGNPITGNGDQALQPGDPVKFRCSGTGDVQHYEFRVILPNGTVRNKTNTPALVATGNLSGEYAIPMAGHFTAQCRICTSATSCQPYEDLSNNPAGQHCGGNIANAPTCPGGFTCQLDTTLPDAGGTCEPINNTAP